MELDDPFLRVPGQVMQPVDVLRDETVELAPPFELDERTVRGVRFGVPERLEAFQLLVPVLGPRGLGRHEVLVVHGIARLPDSLRAAEVRDPGARGDAGAGEHQEGL